MIILEQDHQRFTGALELLLRESNAKLVFLIDRAGQQIASAGEASQVDPTALASLTAGNVAATEGVARLLGEEGFSTLFHEGQNDSLHISGVANKVILLVVFDERSSLGLVRLRVQQRTDELTRLVGEVLSRGAAGSIESASASNSLEDLTDEDIDALFGTVTGH